MSEISDLLDEWLSFHAELGTRASTNGWKPVPASADDIATAIDKLGGPDWPTDVIDLLNWARNGCVHDLFTFGSLAPLDRIVELSPSIGYASDECGRPDEGFTNPYPLLISIEYPCTYVDRAGEAPGKVWANDAGTIFDMAGSLTQYVETCVRMARNGEMQLHLETQGNGLTFRDHDTRWGPAASA